MLMNTVMIEGYLLTIMLVYREQQSEFGCLSMLGNIRGNTKQWKASSFIVNK